MDNQRKSRKPLLIGVLVLAACVGLGGVAVLQSEEMRFHLATAQNYINRWSCPPGAFTSSGRGRGDCVCTKCPPGYKCAGRFTAKQACSAGTFQNVAGQTSCKNAPAGTFVPSRGAKAATPCRRGYYNDKVRQTSCKAASPGNFVGGTGSKGQKQCPVGKYQNQHGQASCKPAPAGKFVNKLGQRAAIPCNFGHYQKLTGKTSCVPASPGNFVPSRGQQNQRRCPANKYQNCGGQMGCLPCSIGLQSGVGATRCSANLCNNNKLAYRKPSFQSSIGWHGDANRAVDGKKYGHYGRASCTHTAHDLHPYWFTDMGRSRSVCKVEIMNRQDCCAGRLSNFVIFVTNKRPSGPANKYNPTNSEICARVPGTFNGLKTFNCKGNGRYVGIQIRQNNKQYLTLCEVTVIGS